MKKILITILAFLTVSVSANAAPFKEYTQTQQMTAGVVLKKIQKFYGDYSQNISCVEVDLKNPHLSLELLKSANGCDKALTVDELVKTRTGVIAATNADFFSYYKNGQYFSLGIEVKDGKLLQSHIQDTMAAGLFGDGKLDLSYFKLTPQITAANGAVLNVTHINKPTDYYGALLMYTSDFNGGISPYLPQGVTVVTIENDVVTAKGVSFGGTVPIKEGSYILVIDDVMTPLLDINTNIGDKLDLKITASPSLENVQTAFGGGTLLLKDGEKTEITHNVGGNNPRTAIGTNDDGSVVYMVTVDGRQTVSRGVSLGELADIMKELGCKNAMNLDGGGSTKMVGKSLENQNLSTINSPTENRKVINAIAVVSDAQPQSVAGFLVKPERENVLLGDSVQINVTPYDCNYNKPLAFEADMSWQTDGGSISNNVYTANECGLKRLDFYCNGIYQTSTEVNVIDSVGINAKSTYTLKKGDSINAKRLASVFDKDGNTAVVENIALLHPKYDQEMLSFENGKFTAIKEGASTITLSYKEAVRAIKIICGSGNCKREEAFTADVKMREETGGVTFNIMASSELKTFFERISYSRAADLLRKGSVSAILGGKSDKALMVGLSPISAKAYSAKQVENALIISLCPQAGSLGLNQWSALSTLVNGAKEKNIFILQEKAPDFKSALESRAFDDTLKQTAKVKNVFVIYKGEENCVVIDCGVRYISLAGAGDFLGLKETMGALKYLSFNITSDDATYTFKKLY